MTPQVAVGAAAGTAVVGGGGALAAYAAGAFNSVKRLLLKHMRIFWNIWNINIPIISF
ncbi:hypothetical protein MHSWG343_10800 [Candidatus Mycoplasma haematohominis]|uniref:Uncharacterized protein n=1 Tax=Candidatus Mycoplasma haematohominis TaxID=1494318 RepID=A0A478FRL4_9MOLU|nr:hypothetical protein MHSWG343_10800 [Candidatus Mycoplasma haemohominis]